MLDGCRNRRGGGRIGHNRWSMLLRSLLLLAGMLLLVAALASVVSPRVDPGAETTPVVTTPVAQPGEGVAVAPALRWELPGKRLLRANVGDVIEITVDSGTRDVAELPQLGLDAPVDVGVPATLRFVADRPGRFSVMLRYAEQKLGVLQVEPSAT
jgi:hypothetical protein